MLDISFIKESRLVNLPRWNPKNHPRMAEESRAMQFHPFDFSGQLDLDEEKALEILRKTGDYETAPVPDEEDGESSRVTSPLA